jgi:hypothetical protein
MILLLSCHCYLWRVQGVVGTPPEDQFILAVYEIDGFIDEYRAICSNFIIILTGGDTEFWLND